jgi:hypothetical protein
LIGGDMRRDLKTYVWMKDVERRKKDRRKKVVDGIIIKDYDRRKEKEKDERYIGVGRRRSEDRRRGKNRRLK